MWFKDEKGETMNKLVGMQKVIFDHRYDVKGRIYYKYIKKDKKGRYRNLQGEYVTPIKDFGMDGNRLVHYD